MISEASTIGVGKGQVSWAKLHKAQGQYIQQKYLPNKVTLQQYYHFHQKDANAILEHWIQRQAASKVPFYFIMEVKVIWKNQRTLDENDEPQEEAEQDPEDDGDIQVWQNLDNGQDAAQPSTAANVHAPQQTGRCTASNLHHTPLSQIPSQDHPHHHPLAHGSPIGQTNGASTEHGQSLSGPAKQEPPHKEVSNPDHPIDL
jgi:hypothetical protein